MYDLDTIRRMNKETEENALDAAKAMTEDEIKAAADAERAQNKIGSGPHGQLTIGDIMRPIERPDDKSWPEPRNDR